MPKIGQMKKITKKQDTFRSIFRTEKCLVLILKTIIVTVFSVSALGFLCTLSTLLQKKHPN